MIRKLRASLVPLLIGTVASSFYIYDFIVRVMPTAMTNELMSSFHIEADRLGIMAAGFFWGYALMQIPAGALCDRFGARRLLTGGLLICALATGLFGITHHFGLAVFSRILMGLTTSIAYLGALWVGAYWLGSKRFVLYVGLVQLLGCVGAIIGTAPVAHLTDTVGWQKTTLIVASIGLIFAVLNWIVIRDKPKTAKSNALNAESISELSDQKRRLATVLKEPQSWWVTLFGFAIWGPTSIFATLWGVPFLMAAYGFDKVHAASLISLIWVGIAIGGPAFGWWTSHIKRRRLPMLTAAIIGLIAALSVIYVPSLPQPILMLALLLFGIGSSGQALAFGVVLDINHRDAIGTASGLTNMGVIFAGVIIQPIIGYLLNIFWNGKMLNGAPLYSAHSYQEALILVPFCFLLALIIGGFLIHETYCQKKYPNE